MVRRLVEAWRIVPGFTKYAISTRGRVIRLDSGRIRKAVPNTRTKRKGNYPYLYIGLYRNGSMKMLAVHKLVASAFLGPPPKGLEVNHEDGDPSNNALGNLEYITHQKNIEHAFKMGLVPRASGEAHYRARLSEDSVRKIRKKLKRHSIASVARSFNVSVGAIQKIKNGTTWKGVV